MFLRLQSSARGAAQTCSLEETQESLWYLGSQSVYLSPLAFLHAHLEAQSVQISSEDLTKPDTGRGGFLSY